MADLTISFDADAAEAISAVEALNAELDRLNDQTIAIKLDLKNLAQVKAQIAALAAETINIKVELDGAAEAQTEMAAVDVAAKALDGKRVALSIDVANTAEARAQMALVLATAERLDGFDATINVEVRDAQAMAELTRVVAAAKAAGMDIKVNVDMDAGAFMAEAAAVEAMKVLLGSDVTINIDTDAAQAALGAVTGSGSNALAMFSRVGNILSTVTGIISGVVGALGGFVAIMAIAAAGSALLTAAVAALGLVAVVAFGGFGAAMLAVGAALTFLVISANDATKQVKDEFKNMWKDMQSGLTEIAKPFTEVMHQIAGAAKEAGPLIKQPLVDAFQRIADAAKVGIEPIKKSLIELANGFRDITNILAPQFEQFFKAMPALTGSVVKALTNMSQAFHDVATVAGDDALAAVGKFIEKMGELGAKLIEVGGKNFTFFTTQFNAFVDKVISMVSKLEPAIQPSIQAFFDLAGAIADVIGDNAAGIKKFAENVSSSMGQIKSIGDDLVALMLGMGDAFIDGLKSPEVVAVFHDLVTTFNENKTELSNAVTDIIVFFGRLAQAAIMLIGWMDRLGGVMNVLLFAMNPVLGVTNALTPAWGSAAPAAKGFGDEVAGVNTSLQGTPAVATPAATTIKTMGDNSRTASGLVAGLTDTTKALGPAGTAAATGVDKANTAAGKLEPTMGDAATSAKNFAAGMKTGFNQADVPVKQFVDKVKQDLAQLTVPLIKGGLDMLHFSEGFRKAFDGAASLPVTTFVQTVTEKLTSLQKPFADSSLAIQQFTTNVKLGFLGADEGVKLFVASVLAEMAKVGPAFDTARLQFQGLVDHYTQGFAALGTVVTTFVTGFVTDMATLGPAFDTARVQFQGFVDHLTQGFRALVAAVQTACNEMKAALQDLISFMNSLAGQAETAGANLMLGFHRGIDREGKAAVAAAKDYAAQAAAALNVGAGNGSPSIKGHQSGVWLGQGFIDGIESMAAGADKAAFNMGATAAVGVKKGIAGISSPTLTGSFNAPDTFVTVMIGDEEFKGYIRTEISKDRAKVRQAYAVQR